MTVLMNSETLQVSQDISYTLYSKNDDYKAVVFYLHGGGLIYGSKSDIPRELVNIFLNKDIAICCLDYLLAPNSGLDDILDVLFSTFDQLYSKYIISKDLDYYLMGRSAGSYLMFLLAKHLIDQESYKNPSKIINFYGFYNLELFNKTNTLSKQAITPEMIKNIDTASMIADDPRLTRFLLYLYLQQNNKMLEALKVKDPSSTKYSIEQSEFKKFPAIFSVASITDKEVPMNYSKSLKNIVSGSKFIQLYYLEHDFLKDTSDSQVKQVFTQLDEWL